MPNWKRELMRWVLGLNWCIAGVACSMVVYTHARIWGVACQRFVRDDMVAVGVFDPSDDGSWEESNRRAREVQSRLATVERLSYCGWLLAMFGGAGTAIGLMIAFPKPPKPSA